MFPRKFRRALRSHGGIQGSQRNSHVGTSPRTRAEEVLGSTPHEVGVYRIYVAPNMRSKSLKYCDIYIYIHIIYT